MDRIRCKWSLGNELLLEYHDKEWGVPLHNDRKHLEGQPEACNELSDTISKDLKSRGFKFLDSVTVFSHLQAAGIINDHSVNCWKFKELSSSNCIIK